MSRLVDGPCKQIGTTLLPTMGGNNRRRIFFVSHLTISWSPSSSPPPSLDGLLGARGEDGCCTALCGFLLLTHHHLNSTPIPLHLHLHHHRHHHHHHHGLPSYYPTFPKCYALGIKGGEELLLLHMALNIFWIDWFDTIETRKGKSAIKERFNTNVYLTLSALWQRPFAPSRSDCSKTLRVPITELIPFLVALWLRLLLSAATATLNISPFPASLPAANGLVNLTTLWYVIKGCTQPNISNVQAAFLEYLQRNVLWPRVSDQGTVTRMTMMDRFFSSYDPRWWIGHSCKEVWELPWCLRALSRPDSHLLFSFSPTHGSKRELFWDFWEFPSKVVILRGGGPRIGENSHIFLFFW